MITQPRAHFFDRQSLYHATLDDDSLTEICQLEFALLADEEILRLDVAVQDPPAVAVAEAPQELEQEQPHVPGAEAARILLEVLRQVRVLKRTDGENTELFKNIPAKF